MSSAMLARGEQRIGELIVALEALPDQAARDCTRELLQNVLEVHGAGLARLLAILSEAGEPGRKMIEALARDDAVRPLLLLYGLHPQHLSARVHRALDQMSAWLDEHGIRAELVDASEASVRIKLAGRWRGEKLSPVLLAQEIEAAIFAQAPDVAAVEIEGLPGTGVQPLKFVPAATASARDLAAAQSGG
jgi:Fe-S cluster biogenesis protein NfuA